MGERAETAPAELVERHVKVLGRLPYGSMFFDRTAQIDLKLVEKGTPELANELAMLEEQMGEVAEEVGATAAKADGVALILAKDPTLGARLADLLARMLPILGNPVPQDLAGKVAVAVDLHLTAENTEGLGILRRGKLDAETN
jgi:hypothetical protein